jgi:hypothetical protein
MITVTARSKAWVFSTWILVSWVWIPLSAWIFVSSFCVGSGLATRLLLVQDVQYYQMTKKHYRPDDGGQYAFLKRRSTSTRLYDATSREAVIVI